MKRFFPVLLMAIFVASLFLMGFIWLFSLLFSTRDAILDSLPDYESKTFYTSGGFQDFTDYGKYTYRIYETELMENPYFQQVTEDSIPEIHAYLDNFENWVAISSDFPREAYDFDRSQVQSGDYFYILNRYDEPEKEFWSYNVYYFDLDNGILYYFHNNR